MQPRRGSWHRCERWFRRGYPCPYRELGTTEEEDDSDEEEERRTASKALPIPIVGERRKTQTEAVGAKIINIEDIINEQPPVDVPIPDRVAATKPVSQPPAAGAGQVPLFTPQPGRGGQPGAGVPPPKEAWDGAGARELARGITPKSSPPRDELGVGAAHSLWTAPMPINVQAKVLAPPRFGEAPIPLYENELARASNAAKSGKAAHVPSPVIGVRSKPAPVQRTFSPPPAEIAKETKGVVNTIRRGKVKTPFEAADNNWAVAATIGSAMAAVAVYALGKGGPPAARALEKAITSRIPDNRAKANKGGARGSVRPGGQVFDFWDMMNGIGFQ